MHRGPEWGGYTKTQRASTFFWKSPFYLATQARMVSSSNPTGDVTIKNPDLGALLMQILIYSPRMAPLAHIHAHINNTAAQRWANRGSASTTSSIRTTLWELYLAARRKHIYASIGRVPGEDNKMADAASWLTHLVAFDACKGRRGGDNPVGGTFP